MNKVGKGFAFNIKKGSDVGGVAVSQDFDGEISNGEYDDEAAVGKEAVMFDAEAKFGEVKVGE